MSSSNSIERNERNMIVPVGTFSCHPLNDAAYLLLHVSYLRSCLIPAMKFKATLFCSFVLNKIES